MRSSQFTQLFKVLLAFILTIGVVSVSWAAVATTSQNSSELIVNTTSDEHDVLPGDGLCQTAVNDCSLRAALEEANVLSGIDHISFNIPGTASHTILPHSPLPPIIEAVIIDGHTEPDYVHAPVIILDGSQAGEQATGLMIVAGNSIVRGLAIHSFEYSGLTLLGGGNSRIESNYLGTTGTLAQGNQIGILVEGSTQNSIGGNAAGNLISGNEIGIYLYGLGSSENRVAANFIGTDADGTTVIGNEYGIRITAADGNLIGGNTAAARNVITGNETGIYIQGKGSSGNRIWGNYIGLDITGETILGNEALGIYILDAPGNQVGGPTTRGNVIAGGELGVYVRGQGSKGNLVRNNLIGTNADQEQPAERISGGVLIIDAENTNVGGSQSKQGNHIVTEQYGVRLRGTAVGKTSIENNSLDVFDDQKEEEENRSEEGAAIDSTSTTAYSSPAPTDPAALVWNFKGREIRAGRLFAKLSQRPFRQSGSTFTVNSTGDAGDANIGDGICADSGGNCTLRAAIEEANDTVATDTIAFNIPGTGPHTIQPNSQLPTLAETTILDGSTEPDFAGTPIIELDGSNAGAGASGLKVAGTDCIIRGLVINRFDNDGIFLDTEAVNATIEGNYIGTNISGTVALGNLDDGITLWETANATIGGVTTATRNLISGNADDGILLYNEGADGNLIQGNVIGLDINGAVDLGNGGNGIQILTGDANTIGGTTAGAGNLISGNDWNGIRLAWGSNNNTIQGNIIGLDVSGMIDLGNGNHGIDFNNATDNTIGGTTTTARNIIAGNDQDGIHLTSPATIGSLIQGNYIGTNISGAAALGNGDDGIDVSNGANNTTIGGATAGEGNLISGNGDEGIHLTSNTNSTAEILVQGNYIGTNAAGTAVIGNGDMGIFLRNVSNSTIGGVVNGAGNLISGNNDGIQLWGSDSTGNLIQGNVIGLDINGAVDLGNGGNGIQILTGDANTIGGTVAGAGNLISGNDWNGIRLAWGSNNNTIQGNIIGLDVSGMIDLGNGNHGIDFNNATDNTIGGTTTTARNIIAGNNQDGIHLTSPATIGSLIQGNYIGTNISGTVALGNGDDGIDVSNGANNTTIGGATAGEGNLISGNGDEGIHLTSNTNSTAEILVQGNYIGTNAAGTAVIGNGDMGISLRNVSNSTIGGVVNGAGNLISGNNTHGIRLEYSGSTGNLIQGNLIGTAADGTTALGNGSRGISFYPNAPDGNTIGGTEAAAGNIIAYNGEEGIYVESSGSENTIRANRIFSNGDLGIDLASFGVTNNDSGDADSGANLRQNYPVLNTAVTSGSSSTISGTLNSNANLIFTLDFYGNSSCDPSGYGEGEFYLGSDTITTDSNGDVSFISTLSAGTLDNPILTATATDPNGNTSEFSTCITATITTTEPVANFIATPLSGTAPLTVTFTNLSTNFTSSSWQFGDGGTSSLPNPTHVYTQSGAYTVTLQVTGAGGSDTEVKVGYITVGISSATTADFSATPITGTVPLTVTFTNLSTNFTSSSWQFGDGSNSSLANPTHVYAQAGTYTVTLQVTGAGGSDTEIKVGYITVDAPPPTVNFSATPITGTVPLSVTFTNLSTNFTISSWQFGDGGNSSLANPTHVYTQAGTYTVTLQVTGAGGSDTEIKVGYITVDDFVGSSRNWQQIITVNSPTVVGEYGMAFDSDQNVAVLYGGNATGWPYENSTWEFDGTDWTGITTTTQPTAVYGMSMVYDDANNVLLLFGGSDATDTPLAETWTYSVSSNSWGQITTTTLPSARSYSQMVYTGDGVNTKIYLFGGNDGTIYFDDVWRYDGTDWSQVTTSGSPPPARTHHAIAYDSVSDEILLFGGRNATGTLLTDSWVLDLSNDTWSQSGSSGPAARMAHGLAYDPTNDNFVLVAGNNNDGDTILNDTWHYDSGSGWTLASPTQAAPNTAYHLLIYDSTNDLFLLFTNGETWQYQ